MDFTIRSGFAEPQRHRAARLYLDAFDAKIGGILGRDARAEALMARIMNPAYALSAVDGTGALLGLAGFKTKDGALTEGGLADLRHVYGALGGLWRGLVLGLLEREVEAGCLLMDGICVHADARGAGVGGALLDAVADLARRQGCHEVRLDVIAENPRARALYERKGFVAGQTSAMGPLRHLFGFSAATTMRLALPPSPDIDPPV